MKRMRVATIFLLSVASLLWPMRQGEAGCVWTWDCSSRPCQQVPVCEGPFDRPGFRPHEFAPNPLPSPIPPSPRPVLPPFGTQQCFPRYVCSYGSCSWQTLCK